MAGAIRVAASGGESGRRRRVAGHLGYCLAAAQTQLLALDAVALVRLNPSIRGASTACREPRFLVLSCVAKKVAQQGHLAIRVNRPTTRR
jgi:hypothetical protein